MPPGRPDYWRLNGLPNDIAMLPLDGHPGPEATRTPAGSYTHTIRLSPRSDSPDGRWPDHIDRYQRLLGYGAHAGQFALHELVSGSVAYTETHAGESLLVVLRPPDDASASHGGYYLVSGVEDATTLPEVVCLLEFELVFLAPLDDYADLTEAQAALEADGI